MSPAKHIWTFLLALGLLPACSEAAEPAAPTEPTGAAEPATPAATDESEDRYDRAAIRARAAAGLQPFKQQLMQALQRGLAQGPENAIDVCRLDAPAIAAAASIDGLEIGRSSHRLRNPANAPTDWQRRAIDHYLGSQDRDPMVIDLGDNRVGYAEPITTAPMCLTCHGNELSAEVRGALAEHYPADQATGFAAGDLRGVFWVTLPVPDA